MATNTGKNDRGSSSMDDKKQQRDNAAPVAGRIPNDKARSPQEYTGDDARETNNKNNRDGYSSNNQQRKQQSA